MCKLIRIGNWISVLFFYLVGIVALKSMILESYLSAILMMPVLYVAVSFCRRYKCRILVLCNKLIIKYRILIWLCLQIFSVIFMFIMAIRLRVNFSWDWGKLLSTAMDKVMTGEWHSFEYYWRCANNQPWLICLTIYFKIVHRLIPSASEETFYMASVFLSVVFTQTALWLIYQTARLLFDEMKAFLVGVVGLGCLPFYLYAQFAYTDTVSMMLVIFTLYLYLKIRRGGVKSNKRYFFLILLLTVVAVFIFKIKILTFIVIIAVILDSVLICKDYNKLFIILAVCCIGWGTGNKIVAMYIENELPISNETADQYELSWTHYVMMGMNHYGGYLQEDVDFSRNAGNYKEKQKANLAELKRRISEYGLKGSFRHLFYTKLSRTWGNSCLAGDDYSHREPYYEDSTWGRIFGAGEELHWIVLIYTWFFHMLMLLGILIEGICSLKEETKGHKFMVLRYTMLGVGIFLTLWECNSRYLLPFLPVMILLSCRGWEILNKSKKKAVLEENINLL